jgi:cobalt-zinc-cadmium resistance protein CzcA
LSDVKCYFKWGTDYNAARQEVINRLQFVELPPGTQPELSPWNAIGEVFRYRVTGKDYPTQDLKTTEDWTLERQFKQVPGVIDVVSYGGETKQYHVDVDPFRLRGYNTSLNTLMSALSNSNQNVGGQRLFLGEQTFNVRGVGLLHGVHDAENIVVSAQKGTPIRVKDLAEVKIGAAPRLGIVGQDDDPDIVQGIILMRYGAETKPTLDGVYKKIDEIRQQHLLKPGVDITPYYDRGHLVEKTTHTVLENMLVGMTLVTIVLLVFLGNTRAALITALTIPISLLIALSGMVLTDTPANLISLGVVDFGIVVDSTVIMTENIFRHMGSHGKGTMGERILGSAKEVGQPMMFSTVIIGVAFLPLFTMQGVEGVIFSPMART